MEAIISGINWLDDFIWGMPMIVLLLGTHLFMTVRTGFIQRKTFTGILLSVRKDPDVPPAQREPVPGPHHRPGVHHR